MSILSSDLARMYKGAHTVLSFFITKKAIIMTSNKKFTARMLEI